MTIAVIGVTNRTYMGTFVVFNVILGSLGDLGDVSENVASSTLVILSSPTSFINVPLLFQPNVL